MNGPESSGTPAESNEGQIPLPQAVKKKSKRKRAYSRSLKKGASDKKQSNASLPAEDPPSLPAPTASSFASSVQRSATTEGAARKNSKADLQRELKSVLEQNALLRSQLDAANKQLKSSESKRKMAATSLEASQAKSREYKKALRDSESVVSSQAKQISLAREETNMVVEEKMELLKRKHQVSTVFVILLFLDSMLQHTVYSYSGYI